MPVAPQGLPANVRDRVHADVGRILNEPDVKAHFETFAFENVGWSPAEIERQAAAKSEVYSERVRRKNISPE